MTGKASEGLSFPARALRDSVGAGTMARDEHLDALRSVADAAGMADRLIRDLFDATWHAHRRARGAGSGLGLRIAQGIALAHGGTLRAESAPGAGATFTLTLPAAVEGPR